MLNCVRVFPNSQAGVSADGVSQRPRWQRLVARQVWRQRPTTLRVCGCRTHTLLLLSPLNYYRQRAHFQHARKLQWAAITPLLRVL